MLKDGDRRQWREKNVGALIKEVKAFRGPYIQGVFIIIIIIVFVIILHDKQKNTTYMNLTLSLKISVRNGAASEKTYNYNLSPT